MNEMNWLETQLKSWEPRRPSPSIKRRLFGRRTGGSSPAWAFVWFAPAAASMLLAVAVTRQPVPSGEQVRTEQMVAVVLSNQICSYLQQNRYEESENHLVLRSSFEWTNRGVSGSSIRFMPFTNSTD